jgi:hypothetical protein
MLFLKVMLAYFFGGHSKCKMAHLNFSRQRNSVAGQKTAEKQNWTVKMEPINFVVLFETSVSPLISLFCFWFGFFLKSFMYEIQWRKIVTGFGQFTVSMPYGMLYRVRCECVGTFRAIEMNSGCNSFRNRHFRSRTGSERSLCWNAGKESRLANTGWSVCS